MIKAGDKVICINNNGDYLSLTEGKEYSVLSRSSYHELRHMLYNEWLALEREKQIKMLLDE